jgi:hypothetical protein
VRRITERGYRNMAGSKNPEASVTGALSRDLLFTRLGPATYALAVRTPAAWSVVEQTVSQHVCVLSYVVRHAAAAAIEHFSVVD